VSLLESLAGAFVLLLQSYASLRLFLERWSCVAALGRMLGEKFTNMAAAEKGIFYRVCTDSSASFQEEVKNN
jgi:hypothetical protein